MLELLSGEVEGVPPAAPITVEGVRRTDDTVPGPGGPIPVRWYRSADLDPAEPAPTLVWVHGGGWQYGDLDMPEADSVGQLVAAGLPGVVVTVDYRLAPRDRHPAALDDVLAAFRAVVAAGPDGGVDADNVALGGGSAGAHLSTVAALDLAAEGPTPAALLLAYPVTDPDGGPYGERHPDCPPVLWLGHEGTMGLFRGYLPEDHDGPFPIAVGRDLSALPPTLVTTAEVDSLRPQALRLVELARQAGAEVEHHDVDGVLHGYLNTVGDVSLADAALARHLVWLRSILAAASGT